MGVFTVYVCGCVNDWKVGKYQGLCMSFASQVSQMDSCSLIDVKNGEK